MTWLFHRPTNVSATEGELVSSLLRRLGLCCLPFTSLHPPLPDQTPAPADQVCKKQTGLERSLPGNWHRHSVVFVVAVAVVAVVVEGGSCIDRTNPSVVAETSHKSREKMSQKQQLQRAKARQKIEKPDEAKLEALKVSFLAPGSVAELVEPPKIQSLCFLRDREHHDAQQGHRNFALC